MQAPLFRLVVLIGLAILLLVAGVASARERGGSGPYPRGQINRPAQHSAAPTHPEAPHPPEPAPRPAPAGVPTREEGNAGSPQQRAGHLTPDERKALRRQIDEARDVYRPYTPQRP